MIELALPKTDLQIYISTYNNTLFGPLKVGLNTIKVRLDPESIKEKRGFYGENDVLHQSASGRVTLCSVLRNAIPAPTTHDPDTVRFDAWVDGLYKPVTYQLPMVSGSLRRHPAIIGSTQMMIDSIKETSNGFIYRTAIHQSRTKPYPIYVTEYKFVFGNMSDTKMTVVETYSASANITSGPTLPSWTAEDLWGVSTPLYVRTSTQYLTLVKVAPSMVDPRHELLRLHRATESFQYDFPLEDADYGYMAKDAFDSRKVHGVNLWEFIADLRHPQRLIPQLKNLKDLKGLSSEYLRSQYGILPTYSDLKELYGVVHKHSAYRDPNRFSVHTSSRVDRGSEGNVRFTLEQRIKLALRDREDPLDDLIDRLESVGVIPSLSNLWDLVPYSFVVDWFVDIGEVLDNAQFSRQVARIPVAYVTSSRKSTVDYDVRDKLSGLIGNIQSRWYHRWVSHQCPLPPLLPENNQPSVSDHMIEAGALIITRSK